MAIEHTFLGASQAMGIIPSGAKKGFVAKSKSFLVHAGANLFTSAPAKTAMKSTSKSTSKTSSKTV